MSESKKILLVFVHEELGKKKRFGRWLQITRDQYDTAADNLERGLPSRYFARRMKGSALSSAWPGATYEVEAEGNAIYPTTATYVGLLPNEDLVLRWSATHKSIVAAANLEARMKKDKRIDRLLERLEPLQIAYHRATGREREALLAAVIGRITRGA